MKYNFDEVIPRRHSNSYKWDSTANDQVLPMWVADMDFRTAQPIIDALTKRVEHGIFGYTKVPDTYFDAIKKWFSKHHDVIFDKEFLLFTTGVVPALSAIIMSQTKPGDKIIVQTPVYNCFFSSIRNNGCEIVSNDLLYRDNSYTINFEDLEQKASDPKVKLLLLCNPHNPVGRVWTREELEKIGDICIKHHVLVISDEIHCDLTQKGFTHIPFAALGDKYRKHSVTCIAPSKTFNLAGLQAANIYAYDNEIRKKIDKALNVNEVCEINPFAVEALIAAYTYGDEWLEQLKIYINDNYIYLNTFFAEHLSEFPVMQLEATYLVWIDCSALKKKSEEITTDLLENHLLWVNPGTIYGSNGEGFIRINIACPRQLLIEGLDKIKKAFIE